MVFSSVMAVMVIFVLIASSISDIKNREVADSLSWGLLFAALILRVLFSISLGVELIISGLIGLGICFVISMILYYTGQWGGADSKLLMGMGAVIGVDFLFTNLATSSEISMSGFDLLGFIVLLLFSGSTFSLLYSVQLAASNWAKFILEFRHLFYESSGYFKVAIAVFIVSLLLGFKVHWLFSSLGLIVILSYLLFVGIVAVERACFVQKRSILNLVQGDWLVEKVRGEKGATIYPKTLDYADLQKLLRWYGKGIVKKVTIKEGVPFVPAFLIAYILLLSVQKWLPILQSFL